MKSERPVNLDLFKFKFPVMAITSVLHRMSGVLIFLFFPAMLYILHQSLLSQENLTSLQECLQHPVSKLVIWVLLAAVIFHLLAGIRHLIMDLGCAESKNAGRVTAWLVITVSALLIVLMGIWLW